MRGGKGWRTLRALCLWPTYAAIRVFARYLAHVLVFNGELGGKKRNSEVEGGKAGEKKVDES